MGIMRKKIYTQSYFLINFNSNYSYSLGVRVKYVGLNLFLVGWALERYFTSMLRLKVCIDFNISFFIFHKSKYNLKESKRRNIRMNKNC